MSGFGVDRGSGSSSGSPDGGISEALIDAKGDLIVGTAADTADRLAVGANGTRVIADSAQSAGLRYAADTENTVADAKGDLLVGTAADTIAKLTVGANNTRLVADSAQTTGLKYVADTQNTVVDAKGDLLAGTAADTVARLAVGTDDQALLADASQSTGLRWGGVPSATVRQTQLAGPVDSSGYNATLAAGAALNFNVDATPTNVVLTFANGFGTGGSVDSYTVLTADASNQGSLNASNTHYISATRTSSSAVTWGQYLVPPDYAYAFDRTRGALLNFEAANGSTTTTDDFGNTWTITGGTISTAKSKFGTSSLVLAAGQYVESTGYTTLGDGSWEMSIWWNSTSLAAVNSVITAVNGSSVGVIVTVTAAGKISLSLSSDGSTSDIASASLGSTTLVINTWYKIRVVFDALAGTYRVYVSNNGAAESQEVTVSSTARISAITKIRLGASAAAGTSTIGNLDAFRFIRAASVTTTETPSSSAPSITEHPYHWFSIPEMKMYEVTSASASGGTNPGMTRRDRIFVGECDTNGSTVTATRNYALRGEYISADTAIPGTGTRTAFSANIGTYRVRGRALLRNYIADAGYTPGMVVDAQRSHSAFSSSVTPAIETRNIVSVATGDSSNGFSLDNRTTGASASLGAAADWKLFVQVSRAF